MRISFFKAILVTPVMAILLSINPLNAAVELETSPQSRATVCLDALKAYLDRHPNDGSARMEWILELRKRLKNKIGTRLADRNLIKGIQKFEFSYQIAKSNKKFYCEENWFDELEYHYRMLFETESWAHSGRRIHEFIMDDPVEMGSDRIRSLFSVHYPRVKAQLIRVPRHEDVWGWYAWMGIILEDRNAHRILEEIPPPDGAWSGFLVRFYLIDRAYDAQAWPLIRMVLQPFLKGFRTYDVFDEVDLHKKPERGELMFERAIYAGFHRPGLMALAHLNQRDEAFSLLDVIKRSFRDSGLLTEAEKVLNDLGKGRWFKDWQSGAVRRRRMPERLEAPLFVIQGMPVPEEGPHLPVKLRNLDRMEGVPHRIHPGSNKVYGPKELREAWRALLSWLPREKAWALLDERGQVLEQGHEVLDAKRFRELLGRHKFVMRDVVLEHWLQEHPEDMSAKYQLLLIKAAMVSQSVNGLERKDDLDAFIRLAMEFFGDQDAFLAMNCENTVNEFDRIPIESLKVLERRSDSVSFVVNEVIPKIFDGIRKNPRNEIGWKALFAMVGDSNAIRLSDHMDFCLDLPDCDGSVPPDSVLISFVKMLLREKRYDYILIMLRNRLFEGDSISMDRFQYHGYTHVAAAFLEALWATDQHQRAAQMLKALGDAEGARLLALRRYAEEMGCHRVLEHLEDLERTVSPEIPKGGQAATP